MHAANYRIETYLASPGSCRQMALAKDIICVGIEGGAALFLDVFMGFAIYRISRLCHAQVLGEVNWAPVVAEHTVASRPQGKENNECFRASRFDQFAFRTSTSGNIHSIQSSRSLVHPHVQHARSFLLARQFGTLSPDVLQRASWIDHVRSPAAVNAAYVRFRLLHVPHRIEMDRSVCEVKFLILYAMH